MEPLLPSLEVRGPDGQHFSVELTKDRITIGRFAAYNDIGLEPDPQQLITRKLHCYVERESEGWWIVHNGSMNPTFIRRNVDLEMVRGRALLGDGESILLLGKLIEEGDLLYWELTFHDPLGTKPAGYYPQPMSLEYDWVQAKLFRINGRTRQEIPSLHPQEHKLIRYMDQRNRANDNVPVMCAYEELQEAIWGEEPQHTDGEINHLISKLRKKLELDPKEPVFLQTVRGLGYRLVTRSQRN